MDTALALAMLVVFVPDPPLSRIGTACGSARPGPPASATMSLRGLKTFVKRTFGERAAGAMFTAELTSRAAAITCRLSELRVLDAQALARYDALRDDLEDLETRVAIIFGTAPQRVARATGLPDDWRQRANEALRHSTRLECLIAELLTYDDVWPSDGSGDVRRHPMYAKIDPALTALWDTVNARP
jgi:hypothetical protein